MWLLLIIGILSLAMPIAALVIGRDASSDCITSFNVSANVWLIIYGSVGMSIAAFTILVSLFLKFFTLCIDNSSRISCICSLSIINVIASIFIIVWLIIGDIVLWSDECMATLTTMKHQMMQAAIIVGVFGIFANITVALLSCLVYRKN